MVKCPKHKFVEEIRRLNCLNMDGVLMDQRELEAPAVEPYRRNYTQDKRVPKMAVSSVNPLPASVRSSLAVRRK